MGTFVAAPGEPQTVLALGQGSDNTEDSGAPLPRDDRHVTPPPTSEVQHPSSAGGYRFARRAELEALGLLLGILIVLLVASATIGSPPS